MKFSKILKYYKIIPSFCMPSTCHDPPGYEGLSGVNSILANFTITFYKI